MQIDLSIRKLKALAKRLESDLSLSQAQRRRSLDALARGFGYDGYPALKAAVEANPGAQASPEPHPQSPALPRQLASLPDRDLAGELERRGYRVDPAPAMTPDAGDRPHMKAHSHKIYRAMRDVSRARGQEIMAASGRFIQVEYQPWPETRPEAREIALVPQWLYLLFSDHAEAFETTTGIPAHRVTACNPDEILDNNGDPIDDLGAAEDADGLRQRIARAVEKGIMEGTDPDWQVTLDDPEDPDLRALAAERIAEGQDRDEMGTWRLDCDGLDTAARDPEVVREVIAGLLRQGYTSGHYPHWTLEFDPDADDRESLLEHIASLIDEGFTSGYHPRWVLRCDLIA